MKYLLNTSKLSQIIFLCFSVPTLKWKWNGFCENKKHSLCLIHSLWKWHKCPLEQIILLWVSGWLCHYSQSFSDCSASCCFEFHSACPGTCLRSFIVILITWHFKCCKRKDHFMTPVVANHIPMKNQPCLVPFVGYELPSPLSTFSSAVLVVVVSCFPLSFCHGFS